MFVISSSPKPVHVEEVPGQDRDGRLFGVEHRLGGLNGCRRRHPGVRAGRRPRVQFQPCNGGAVAERLLHQCLRRWRQRDDARGAGEPVRPGVRVRGPCEGRLRRRAATAGAATGVAVAAAAGVADPSQYAQQIEVFHVNLALLADPRQHGHRRPARDMFFDVRRWRPLECANKSDPHAAHDCDNEEVVATDLAVTKLMLGVDSRYGSYGRCNICVNGTDHHGNNSCTDGVYWCSCGEWGEGKPRAGGGLRTSPTTLAGAAARRARRIGSAGTTQQR